MSVMNNKMKLNLDFDSNKIEIGKKINNDTIPIRP